MHVLVFRLPRVAYCALCAEVPSADAKIGVWWVSGWVVTQWLSVVHGRGAGVYHVTSIARTVCLHDGVMYEHTICKMLHVIVPSLFVCMYACWL